MRALARRLMPAVVACVLTLTAAFAAARASAQEKFPSRPLRIVVPYSPGGATDFVARLVAEKAKAALGQPILIDNKPGANGLIGIEELARAKPDGYTLLVGNVTTNAVTPVVLKSKMRIDYDKDVVAVARLMTAYNVLVTTTKDFTPRTFAEVVAFAKQNPGKLRYATNGIGSFLHFDTEIFARRVGIEITHIPYRSVTDMMKGLLAGEVQMAFISTPITIPLAKDGQVRVIANTERRLAPFPDVPTLKELGVDMQATSNWQAAFVPAGTPAPVLAALHKALTDAAAEPTVVEAAGKTGTDLDLTGSPEEAQRWHLDELAKWRRIAEEVKVDLN